LVVAVEMHLVGAPSALPPTKQSILDAGVARGGKQGWEPINAREYLVRDAACPNVARPPHERWHAEGAFPVRYLLVAERGVAAVRPRVHVRAIVSGVDDNRIVRDIEIVERLEQFADVTVVLNHPIGVFVVDHATLATHRRSHMRPKMHAC